MNKYTCVSIEEHLHNIRQQELENGFSCRFCLKIDRVKNALIIKDEWSIFWFCSEECLNCWVIQNSSG